MSFKDEKIIKNDKNISIYKDKVADSSVNKATNTDSNETIQVETLDMDSYGVKKVSKDEVIDAIKKNFDNNKDVNNKFNQELYKRINEEIKNLVGENR